jgi:hypothetical protein
MIDTLEFKNELHELLLSCNPDNHKVAHTMLAGTRNAILYNDFPIDHELSFCALFHSFEIQKKPNSERDFFIFPFDVLETDLDKAKAFIKELHNVRGALFSLANACGYYHFGHLSKVETYKDWKITGCMPGGHTYLKLS